MTRVGKVSGIVVVVLLVIFIIMATPLPHKHPAFEDYRSAVGCLRTINTAEVTYAATYPKVGFSPTLAALYGNYTDPPGEQHAGLVDSELGAGSCAGYRFTYAATRGEKSGLNVAYATHADPGPDFKPAYRRPINLWEQFFPPKPEPARHFYSDQSGVIRYEEDREANTNSPGL